MLNDPEFMKALSQLAVALVSLVATVVIPLVGVQITRYTGVKIEQKHMLVLHEAAATWAQNAVLNGMTAANSGAASSLRDYVKQSAPEAFKALEPGIEVLGKLAGRYIGEALAKK